MGNISLTQNPILIEAHVPFFYLQIILKIATSVLLETDEMIFFVNSC